MRFLFLLIIILGRSLIIAQQINPVWVAYETTNGSSANSFIPTVLIDSFRNAIVCGSFYMAGPATGFITIKYDSSGKKLWERRHQTAATDLITAAATDDEGAIYVGGVTINNPLGTPGNQIVIKYSAEGDTVWQYYLQVEQGVTSSICNLMLDENGNLLIFGSYFDTLQNKEGLMVQKKTPDGTLIWTATHVDKDYSYGARDARWIGDRWVFWGRNNVNDTRLLCWQIAQDGQTLGIDTSELYPGTIYNLHIDKEGSIYMTEGNTYKIIKYDISANKKWTYSKPVMSFPPNIEVAILPALTTDTHLNVYASGHIRVDSFHIDALTVKLNADGENLWEHHLSLPTSSLNLTVYKLLWIKDSVLLAAGEIAENDSSECLFATYNTASFINAQISDIDGKVVRLNSVALDENYFYCTGFSSGDFPEPSKLFLCKYDLQDIISSTTTAEIVTAGQISIRPNPFSNRCTLVIDYTGATRHGSLQLCNAQGAVIFSREVSLLYGLQSFELDNFAQLPNGIYQVSLLTDERLYYTKVVKME